MSFSNYNQITNFSAFKEVFEQMSLLDPERMNNISLSLFNSVKEYHGILNNHEKTLHEKKAALLQEQIAIQAQASKYLTISEEISQKEAQLWKTLPEITDLFFDTLFDKLDVYFATKLTKMYKEIDKNSEWYTGIVDTAKKSGSLINFVMKKANEVNRDVNGKTLTNKNDLIDERSMVEKIMEKHLNSDNVSKDMTNLLEATGEVYQKKWEQEIKAQSPNLDRISAFSLAQNANDSIILDFKIGTAEQTFMVGIGSAVVGTLGLAAGWHTITYALMNVFPPIAFFTVLATVFIGVVTKDKAIQQRKKQIQEAVKQYQRHFMMQFDVVPLSHLNNQTLRKHINHSSEKIVEQTIEQWEKQILGNLKMEHYRLIVSSFSRHLLLIQDAIEDLEEVEMSF
jgi:hypothetical protein